LTLIEDFVILTLFPVGILSLSLLSSVLRARAAEGVSKPTVLIEAREGAFGRLFLLYGINPAA